MQMRVAAHAARAKEVRTLAEVKPKFFNAIFARTSVVSRLFIEADGDFAAANAAFDPNALVAIINRTHFTHVDGTTAVEAIDNLEAMFCNLMQGPHKTSRSSRNNPMPNAGVSRSRALHLWTLSFSRLIS